MEYIIYVNTNRTMKKHVRCFSSGNAYHLSQGEDHTTLGNLFMMSLSYAHPFPQA